MTALIAKGLYKRYSKGKNESFTALQHVDLQWNEDENIAVCGQSGSGKCTLARLLLGLEAPTGGEILLGPSRLNGLSYKQWPPNRRRLQGVVQDASESLNPAWSPYGNMEEGLLNLTDYSSQERRREIAGLMDRFGLDTRLLKLPVKALSGGQQRRVALVRALAVRPAMLILDEVLAGLDFLTADSVLSTLDDYRRSYGCAYLLITHDTYSAERLCDTQYVMEHGRLTRRERGNTINQSGGHASETSFI